MSEKVKARVQCIQCGGNLLFTGGDPKITRTYLGEPITGIGVTCEECRASFSLECITPSECDNPASLREPDVPRKRGIREVLLTSVADVLKELRPGDDEDSIFQRECAEAHIRELQRLQTAPPAPPAPGLRLSGYDLAGCADRAGLVVRQDNGKGEPLPSVIFAKDWDRFAAEVRALATPPPQPVEQGDLREALANDILRRIALRYRDCKVNIYPDLPELTPVEAVLRCAAEEGFVLTTNLPEAALASLPGAQAQHLPAELDTDWIEG